MNKDQYFDSLLNSDRLVINYTEVTWYLNDCKEPEHEFDVIAHLSDQLATRVKTPQHYARARFIMSELALMSLEHNMTEGECEHPELTDLQELPQIDAKEICLAIC